MEITTEDLKRNWAAYCGWAGAALLVLFGWFAATAEEPWREQDRGLAPGKWLQVNDLARSGAHWVTYEYQVQGASYRGEYRCKGCLTGMRESPTPGARMTAEYRFENPSMSRPWGMVSEGRARYHRVGMLMGVALLVAALAGAIFGRPTVLDR